MKFLKEFKEFISRGNVMDLAIAVIVGAAFTAIVNSLVKDLFMPLFSLVVGGIDFSTLYIALGPEETAAKFAYGNFLQALINFICISFVVFLLLKALNKLLRRKKAETPPTKTCPYCASSIPEVAVRCPSCTTILDEDAVPVNLR